jgi:hypothetical protein
MVGTGICVALPPANFSSASCVAVQLIACIADTSCVSSARFFTSPRTDTQRRRHCLHIFIIKTIQINCFEKMEVFES